MPGDTAEAALQEIDWEKATPEQVYAEAKRHIAEAKASGATKLELDRQPSGPLKTLKALPPEISDLPQLQELHLRDIAVEDLSPLTGMTGLQRLTICRVPVVDLSPLSSLTGLNFLFLTQIPASELAPLAALPALETLWLQYGIPVTDLAPLACISSLRRLSLEDCREVTDFRPLAQCVGLTRLDCANTRIADLAQLASCPGLQSLDLSNTTVSDLVPLADLSGLTRLHISKTNVSDLGPLAQLRRLGILSLYSNQLITDIRPLARLTALRTLDLDYTAISDLGPIAEMTAMMGQWTDKSDPYYDPDYDPCGDNAEFYGEYDDVYQDDRRGLHYDETPVAAREPYCWLVRLHGWRRTVETINAVRRTKKLPPHYPEGYEAPGEAESNGGESQSKELIDRVRDHMQQLEQAVREGKKGEGAIGAIRSGALGWLGALLAAAVGYGACFLVKTYEAAVRGWIDQLGGSQTLHWIVDMMVKVIPSIG